MAVLLPVPRTFHHRAGVALEQLHLAAGIELLPAALDECGFVIKRVALAGRAGHEQLHDTPGFGGMMQTAVEFRARLRHVRQQAVLSEQMNHRDAAESAAKAPKKFTAINESGVFRAEFNRRLLRRADVAMRTHGIPFRIGVKGRPYSSNWFIFDDVFQPLGHSLNW